MMTLSLSAGLGGSLSLLKGAVSPPQSIPLCIKLHYILSTKNFEGVGHALLTGGDE